MTQKTTPTARRRAVDTALRIAIRLGPTMSIAMLTVVSMGGHWR